MENVGVVFLAAISGMLCGAVLIAGLFWVYTRRGNLFQSFRSPEERAEADTLSKRPRNLDDAIAAPVLPALPDAYRTLAQTIPPAAGFPWLDGAGGRVAGQRITVDREEMILGRSRVCDVRFDDPKVSRQHAMLRLYKGHYFIQDMQSSRGTLVNNQRVQTHLLQDGDQIRLGDTVLVFRIPPQNP
jgi:hypothetical protein